ncbi:MAG: glycyl-radical enzyme activating protein [Tissierellia bacterium]|nr:glycyl-radical enzyme activating protein [Tissierellia bacterium]
MDKGYLIDIQHFSVNDGDGIRSTIFFAGCPLRCAWCSNPEGFTNMNKVMHVDKLCIECQKCTEVCPKGVSSNLNKREERLKCNNCGLCVKVCPTNSRQNMIFEWTSEEVVDEVSKYFGFFRRSGGGVTYSGGECTMQIDFLTKLCNAFYDLNINQAIETEGYFKLERVLHIFEKMDQIFIDIKHMNTKRHKYFTGEGNELILENIKALGEQFDNIVIRIPLIKGVNADEENIIKTAEFVKENILRNPRMELLPYHRYGESKYETLNITKPSEFFGRPDSQEIEYFEEIIKNIGVEIVSFN